MYSEDIVQYWSDGSELILVPIILELQFNHSEGVCAMCQLCLLLCTSLGEKCPGLLCISLNQSHSSWTGLSQDATAVPLKHSVVGN